MTTVFINEQHTLLQEQKEILEINYPGYAFHKIPATGWDKEKIKDARYRIPMEY